MDDFLTYSDNLRRIDARQHGLALAVVVMAGMFAWLSVPAVAKHASFPPDQFPVRASVAITGLPAGARILAPDMYGGYLIYRFAGARKVFFDGRSDFYGAEFMKDYLRLIELRPGWRQQVDNLAFTHALLPARYSLIPALEQLGWKRKYADEVAILLEKN